jgi:hypothetical protein
MRGGMVLYLGKKMARRCGAIVRAKAWLKARWRAAEQGVSELDGGANDAAALLLLPLLLLRLESERKDEMERVGRSGAQTRLEGARGPAGAPPARRRTAATRRPSLDGGRAWCVRGREQARVRGASWAGFGRGPEGRRRPG